MWRRRGRNSGLRREAKTGSRRYRRPRSNSVFFNPDGQEYRAAWISRLRRAWQEDAGEHAHVQPECVLVNKPVFCRKLDIAWSESGRAIRWSIIAKRHGSGELQVGSRAIIEIETRCAARSRTSKCPLVERVDLEMKFVGSGSSDWYGGPATAGPLSPGSAWSSHAIAIPYVPCAPLSS
jgi:hypothetical protein